MPFLAYERLYDRLMAINLQNSFSHPFPHLGYSVHLSFSSQIKLATERASSVRLVRLVRHCASPNEQRSLQSPVLFLSNGHGEDSIAVAILKELQLLAGKDANIQALPIVGLGRAYDGAKIPIVGPCKAMPSGGFIKTNISHLMEDLLAGLLLLSLGQWNSVAHWADQNPDGLIVAVGDIIPLALAWLVSKRSRKQHDHSNARRRGIQYSFIGTAKSEYYKYKNSAPQQEHTYSSQGQMYSRGFELAALFPASVYFPWERTLMEDEYCRLVAVRDALTAQFLKFHLSSSDKVKYLGNPMMDNLNPSGALDFLTDFTKGRIWALLPGSRAPEVFSNWKLVLKAADVISSVLLENSVFLAPIVPFLEPSSFCESLENLGWQPAALGNATLCLKKDGWPISDGIPKLIYHKDKTSIILLKGCFADVGHCAEAAIAMTGTGTEQLVGLGKPVFTLAGSGPQFTWKFAEAQSRLLGKSVVFCSDVSSLAVSFIQIMSDKVYLDEVRKNGEERMGKPGGARRIAQDMWFSYRVDTSL